MLLVAVYTFSDLLTYILNEIALLHVLERRNSPATHSYIAYLGSDCVFSQPICESELAWLDLSINVSKSSCIRVGPRYNRVCCNLTSLDGCEIMSVEKVRYLGIYLVSSKVMNCNYDLSKSLSIVHLMRFMER